MRSVEASVSDSNQIELFGRGEGVPPHRLHDRLRTWRETLTTMCAASKGLSRARSKVHSATYGCWRFSALG